MNTRCLMMLLLVLSFCMPALAAFDSERWTWNSEVTLDTASGGFARLVLPPEVLDQTQKSLNDLRLIDGSGNLVPYVVRTEQTHDVVREEWRDITLLNESFAPGQYVRTTLDFGTGPVRKNRVRVALSGDNYRRRALLEGSADGQSWDVVVQDIWLFSIKQPAREFKIDTIDFPANDQRYLRLTVYNMPDDPERISLNFAKVAQFEKLPKIPLTPVPVLSLTGPFHEKDTDYNAFDIDVGFRNLPILEIGFQVDDAYFYRGYELLGRNALTEEIKRPRESGYEMVTREVPWQSIHRGILFRVKNNVKASENVTVQNIEIPYRYIQLRAFDGDSPPLTISQANISRQEVSLVFDSKNSEKYVLWGGNPSAPAPNFDLARALPNVGKGDLPLAHAAAPSVFERTPKPLPWTERHRLVIWAALIVVALAMFVLIFRSLGAARPAKEPDHPT